METEGRNKDGDIFSDYSNCKLKFEFETEFSYLTNQDTEDELLVYKSNRLEKEDKYPAIIFIDEKTY